MPGETIECFCSTCNCVVSAQVRATASGDPTGDLFEHLDPGEDGFRGYATALPSAESVAVSFSIEAARPSRQSTCLKR